MVRWRVRPVPIQSGQREWRSSSFFGTSAGLTIRVAVSSVEDNVAFDLYAPTGARLFADGTTIDFVTIERGDHDVVIGPTEVIVQETEGHLMGEASRLMEMVLALAD